MTGIANKVVKNLIESDLDPKNYARSTPSFHDEAAKAAVEEFARRVECGLISNAREADEQASEIAADICIENGLDPNGGDFEAVVSDVFKRASDAFPGNW